MNAWLNQGAENVLGCAGMTLVSHQSSRPRVLAFGTAATLIGECSAFGRCGSDATALICIDWLPTTTTTVLATRRPLLICTKTCAAVAQQRKAICSSRSIAAA